MPVVPEYTSQQNFASRGTPGFLDTADTDALTAGVDQFTKAFVQVKNDQDEKRYKAQALEIESDLRRQSRDSYLRAQEERRGEAALGNKTTGDRGVYEDYDQFSNDYVNEAMGKVDPRFADDLKARLGGVADSYRDRFALYESEQFQQHRAQQFAAYADELRNDVVTDAVGYDYDRENFDYAVQSFSDRYKETHGGILDETKVVAFKAKLASDMIVAASSTDPLKARAMLQDLAKDGTLPPEERKTLDRAISAQAVDVYSAELAESVAAMPYEMQLEEIQKKDLKGYGKDADDIRKAALISVRNEQTIRKEQQALAANAAQNEYFQAALDKGWGAVSVSAIRQDARLEPEARERLILHRESMLDRQRTRQERDAAGGGAKAAAKLAAEMQELRSYENARRLVISGQLDESDLFQKAYAGEIDEKRLGALISLQKDVANGEDRKTASDYLTNRYPVLSRDKEKAARIWLVYDKWTDEQMKRTGEFPSPEEQRKRIDTLATELDTGSAFGFMRGDADSIRREFLVSKAGKTGGKVYGADLSEADAKALVLSQEIDDAVLAGYGKDAVAQMSEAIAGGLTFKEVKDGHIYFLRPDGKTTKMPKPK